MEESWGLNDSTGPDITDRMIVGPMGARIKPVWRMNVFHLTGVDNTDTPTFIGQYESATPFDTHNMLMNDRVGRRPNASTANASILHATGVASILIGKTQGNLRGINSHDKAQLWSAGRDYYDSINNWLTLNPNRSQVLNTSTGFPWRDDERQRIAIPNTVTGGTFTVTFNGATTGALAFNSTAAQVSTALRGLGTINGNVDVSTSTVAGFSRVFNVSFKGFLGGQNVAALTTNSMNLVAGAAQSTTTHQGSATTFNDGTSAATLFADYTTRHRDLVWVKSAGNEGRWAPNGSVTPPADAFNVITVGATGADPANLAQTGNDYTYVAPYSSRGPTNGANARHPIDLVAPGSNITMASNAGPNATQTASGTSFAAPHVAGTAALVMTHARNRGLGTFSDRKAVKAILLNSASKHVRDPLNGGRAWPDSPAAQFAPDVISLVSRQPLDDAMGAGQLNAYAAVRQIGHSNLTSGLTVNRGSIIGGIGEDDYDLFNGFEMKRGSLVSATLVWERLVKVKSGVDQNDRDVLANKANYTTKTFDLDLRLVKEDGTIVARSASFHDSVEHLYFNIREDGKYKIRVKGFTPGGGDSAPYGLAVSTGSTSGISFSVDGGYFNAARINANTSNPAEGLYGPSTFTNNPNDVHSLGPAGAGHFPTEGEIFSGSLDHGDTTNVLRLSGALGTRSRVGPHNGPPAAMAVLDSTQRGVLGLRPNDNVVGLSFGRDGTQFFQSILVFSVDPGAVGAVNTNVHLRATTQGSLIPDLAGKIFPTFGFGGATGGGGAGAGNLYQTKPMKPFGRYRSAFLEVKPQLNALFGSGNSLGLQSPSNRGQLLNAVEDDLDAVEIDDILAYVDTDGDGLHGRPVFFTLDEDSPSLAGGGSAADIWVSKAVDTSADFGLQPNNPFAYEEWANHMMIGLNADDEIDALVVSDVRVLLNVLPFPIPDGEASGPVEVLGQMFNADEVLFSLTEDSWTVLNVRHPMRNRNISPADILYSNLDGRFMVFADAEDLGLLATDNLNALDIGSIPEPGVVWVVMGVVGLGMGRRRKIMG